MCRLCVLLSKVKEGGYEGRYDLEVLLIACGYAIKERPPNSVGKRDANNKFVLAQTLAQQWDSLKNAARSIHPFETNAVAYRLLAVS